MGKRGSRVWDLPDSGSRHTIYKTESVLPVGGRPLHTDTTLRPPD